MVRTRTIHSNAATRGTIRLDTVRIHKVDSRSLFEIDAMILGTLQVTIADDALLPDDDVVICLGNRTAYSNQSWIRARRTNCTGSSAINIDLQCDVVCSGDGVVPVFDRYDVCGQTAGEG